MMSNCLHLPHTTRVGLVEHKDVICIDRSTPSSLMICYEREIRIETDEWVHLLEETVRWHTAHTTE